MVFLHFVLFVFCSICIMLHLYFVTFVFWQFLFCPFLFSCVCILKFWYFVPFVFCYTCILLHLCLYFGIVFCSVCIMEHLYFVEDSKSLYLSSFLTRKGAQPTLHRADLFLVYRPKKILFLVYRTNKIRQSDIKHTL